MAASNTPSDADKAGQAEAKKLNQAETHQATDNTDHSDKALVATFQKDIAAFAKTATPEQVRQFFQSFAKTANPELVQRIELQYAHDHLTGDGGLAGQSGNIDQTSLDAAVQRDSTKAKGTGAGAAEAAYAAEVEKGLQQAFKGDFSTGGLGSVSAQMIDGRIETIDADQKAVIERTSDREFLTAGAGKPYLDALMTKTKGESLFAFIANQYGGDTSQNPVLTKDAIQKYVDDAHNHQGDPAYDKTLVDAMSKLAQNWDGAPSSGGDQDAARAASLLRGSTVIDSKWLQDVDQAVAAAPGGVSLAASSIYHPGDRTAPSAGISYDTLRTALGATDDSQAQQFGHGARPGHPVPLNQDEAKAFADHTLSGLPDDANQALTAGGKISLASIDAALKDPNHLLSKEQQQWLTGLKAHFADGDVTGTIPVGDIFKTAQLAQPDGGPDRVALKREYDQQQQSATDLLNTAFGGNNPLPLKSPDGKTDQPLTLQDVQGKAQSEPYKTLLSHFNEISRDGQQITQADVDNYAKQHHLHYDSQSKKYVADAPEAPTAAAETEHQKDLKAAFQDVLQQTSQPETFKFDGHKILYTQMAEQAARFGVTDGEGIRKFAYAWAQTNKLIKSESDDKHWQAWVADGNWHHLPRDLNNQLIAGKEYMLPSAGAQQTPEQAALAAAMKVDAPKLTDKEAAALTPIYTQVHNGKAPTGDQLAQWAGGLNPEEVAKADFKGALKPEEQSALVDKLKAAQQQMSSDAKWLLAQAQQQAQEQAAEQAAVKATPLPTLSAPQTEAIMKAYGQAFKQQFKKDMTAQDAPGVAVGLTPGDVAKLGLSAQEQTDLNQKIAKWQQDVKANKDQLITKAQKQAREQAAEQIAEQHTPLPTLSAAQTQAITKAYGQAFKKQFNKDMTAQDAPAVAVGLTPDDVSKLGLSAQEQTDLNQRIQKWRQDVDAAKEKLLAANPGQQQAREQAALQAAIKATPPPALSDDQSKAIIKAFGQSFSEQNHRQMTAADAPAVAMMNLGPDDVSKLDLNPQQQADLKQKIQKWRQDVDAAKEKLLAQAPATAPGGDWQADLKTAMAGVQALEQNPNQATFTINGHQLTRDQLKQQIDTSFQTAFQEATSAAPGSTAEFLKNGLQASVLDAKLDSLHKQLVGLIKPDMLQKLGISGDHPTIEQVQNAILNQGMVASTDAANPQYKNNPNDVKVAQLLAQYEATMVERDLVGQQATGAKLDEKAPALVASLYADYLAKYQNGVSDVGGHVSADQVLRTAMSVDRDGAASPVLRQQASGATNPLSEAVSKYLDAGDNPILTLQKAVQNPNDLASWQKAYEQFQDPKYRAAVLKAVTAMDQGFGTALQSALAETDPQKQQQMITQALNAAKDQKAVTTAMALLAMPAGSEAQLAFAMMRQSHPDLAAVQKHLVHALDDPLGMASKETNDAGQSAAQVLGAVTRLLHADIADWTSAMNNPQFQQIAKQIDSAFAEVRQVQQQMAKDPSKVKPEDVQKARDAMQAAYDQAGGINGLLGGHADQIEEKYYNLVDKSKSTPLSDDERAELTALEPIHQLIHARAQTALSLAGMDIAAGDGNKALAEVNDAAGDSVLFGQNPQLKAQLDQARSAAETLRTQSDGWFMAGVHHTEDAFNWLGRKIEENGKWVGATVTGGLAIAGGVAVVWIPVVGETVTPVAEAVGVSTLTAGLAAGGIIGTGIGTTVGAGLEVRTGQTRSYWAGVKDVAPGSASAALTVATLGSFAAPEAVEGVGGSLLGRLLGGRIVSGAGRLAWKPLQAAGNLAMRSDTVAALAGRVSGLADTTTESFTSARTAFNAARNPLFANMARSGAWYAPAANGLRFTTAAAIGAVPYSLSQDHPLQTYSELVGLTAMMPVTEVAAPYFGFGATAAARARMAAAAAKLEEAQAGTTLPGVITVDGAGVATLPPRAGMASRIGSWTAGRAISAAQTGWNAAKFLGRGIGYTGVVGGIDYTKNLGVASLNPDPSGVTMDAFNRTVGDAWVALNPLTGYHQMTFAKFGSEAVGANWSRLFPYWLMLHGPSTERKGLANVQSFAPQ